MLLHIAQHRGMRNLLRHFALLLLLEVLLNVEQSLQVPQRVVDLRLRHLGPDARLAAGDVAVVPDQ